MLFPQLAPQYYNETDRAILSRMEAFYAEAITINLSFWSEADMDTRFYLGAQTLWNDLYGNLPANRRRHFNFNRIMRVVNVTSGFQRRNRKSIIATPVENGDAHTADQFTKCLMHIDQQEGVLETVSEAFQGALITGMNLLHVWMDYREDPINGKIRVNKCDFNSYLIDPYFRKPDLSDCNSLWKRSFLTKREIISLLPDKADEVLALNANDSGSGRDGKFQFMPESYQYAMKQLCTYDEFWYRDYRNQKLLVDKRNGDTMEWRINDDEKLKIFMQQEPDLTLVEQTIPTVNVAIVCNGKVFYDGPNPMGIDKYPFVPVFAYFHPETPYFENRIFGMVRNLRDAQYLYNRRKIIELDILESQINSGWKFKENALVNPKDAFLSGQGRTLVLKEEAQMTDVEQIQSPAIPPTTIALSEALGREVMEISGVNEELLGSASDDKAGILSMLRQGAGLTTLQNLFDQLDHSQKLLGQLLIDLIQINWTPGKIKKILEGEEPAPLFYNKAFGKYHAVVEEGINTSTQRQMQFAQLLQLREVGVPIPDEQLLEACTLQDKDKLIQAITANKQQAAQAQQMQMQAALQEQQARTELAHSRAIADQGLGMERASRVQENQALAEERRAAAIKDEEIGFLNLVKALKEIDTVDIAQLEKLIALSNMMKQHEMQQAQPQQSGLEALKQQGIA